MLILVKMSSASTIYMVFTASIKKTVFYSTHKYKEDQSNVPPTVAGQ